TPRYGGHWIAQSHEAIFEITHDHATFSSEFPGRMMLPIGIDPPKHTHYRTALLQVFSPKYVQALMPMIRQLAVELIDKVAAKGHCEFVKEIAEPLPVIVFMKLLGLPLEMLVPLRASIVEALVEGDPDKRDLIFDRQLEMLDPIIHARMEKPEDDVISRILAAEFDGRKATMAELQSYLLLLTNAGLDTVVNALSFDAMHLARDSAFQDQLRADRKLIPRMVEELLRRYAVSSVARRVTRDVEFRGVSLRAGDRVHLLLPAANLDGKVYAEPDQVMLNRRSAPVTFGTGIHRCLGSHLARLELCVLFEEWLDRIPTFRLDPAHPPKIHAGMVYTVDSLNLAWDA
ncbi:MAG: cytochrome P450, partial [Spongiibacteraceae bacterium]